MDMNLFEIYDKFTKTENNRLKNITALIEIYFSPCETSRGVNRYIYLTSFETLFVRLKHI